MKKTWFTADGYEIEFNKIILLINDHTKDNGRVFIGTDSFATRDHCIFANAICLHGADNQSGGTYFFQRSKESSKIFKNLIMRILSEVEKTINLALEVSELCPDANIELHIDISAKNKNAATSKFADTITGFAKSAGFDFKIKPYSWASSSVADKHSK